MSESQAEEWANRAYRVMMQMRDHSWRDGPFDKPHLYEWHIHPDTWKRMVRTARLEYGVNEAPASPIVLTSPVISMFGVAVEPDPTIELDKLVLRLEVSDPPRTVKP